MVRMATTLSLAMNRVYTKQLSALLYLISPYSFNKTSIEPAPLSQRLLTKRA
jgi:hypothetical protein